MHIHFLDPYTHRTSLIHLFDARVKLILTLVFILTTALIPAGSWPVYIFLLALIVSLEVLSELGVVFIFKRSVIALPFILAAFPLLFTIQGTVLFTVGVGGWEISASQAGLERFLSIAFKSWLSTQAAILLATSTAFPDLLMAMRSIHTPKILVGIFGLMWRYMFVLADEALRLIRARTSRSSDPGVPGQKAGRNLAWRGRIAGGMAGNLFIRAFERSDRIYMAMLSRGYDGEVRHIPLSPLRSVHKVILITGLLTLFILLIFSFFYQAV